MVKRYTIGEAHHSGWLPMVKRFTIGEAHHSAWLSKVKRFTIAKPRGGTVAWRSALVARRRASSRVALRRRACGRRR
jgi:hypothetical protein